MVLMEVEKLLVAAVVALVFSYWLRQKPSHTTVSFLQQCSM
jgi:hypothetical protein